MSAEKFWHPDWIVIYSLSKITKCQSSMHWTGPPPQNWKVLGFPKFSAASWSVRRKIFDILTELLWYSLSKITKCQVKRKIVMQSNQESSRISHFRWMRTLSHRYIQYLSRSIRKPFLHHVFSQVLAFDYYLSIYIYIFYKLNLTIYIIFFKISVSKDWHFQNLSLYLSL